jgi:hypothetical protein
MRTLRRFEVFSFFSPKGVCTNGNHHRVAAEKVSKIERGRPATSVHGYVLAFFRARARSIRQLYHSILVNALLGREFGNG